MVQRCDHLWSLAKTTLKIRDILVPFRTISTWKKWDPDQSVAFSAVQDCRIISVRAISEVEKFSSRLLSVTPHRVSSVDVCTYALSK